MGVVKVILSQVVYIIEFPADDGEVECVMEEVEVSYHMIKASRQLIQEQYLIQYSIKRQD
jgi:hypothetical protein